MSVLYIETCRAELKEHSNSFVLACGQVLKNLPLYGHVFPEQYPMYDNILSVYKIIPMTNAENEVTCPFCVDVSFQFFYFVIQCFLCFV